MTTGHDRWWGSRRARGAEQDVADELEFHVARLTDDLVATGMPREAAAAEAARRFGDRARVQQALERIERRRGRQLRVSALLRELMTDVRYGARSLLRQPGLALAAALSLGLGLSAATVVLGIVDAWLLRPLPVAHASQLMAIGAAQRSIGRFAVPALSLPTVDDLAARRDLFDAVAGWRVQGLGARRPEHRQGRLTFVITGTGNYFDVLGVHAQRGRTFNEADSRARAPVTVLTHTYWQTAFAGDTAVLGTSLLLDGIPFTIIGVMPPGFAGTEHLIRVEAFIPSGVEPVLDSKLAGLDSRRDLGLYQAIARRRVDREVGEVQAGLDALSAQLRQSFPDLPDGYRLQGYPERAARPTISAAGITQVAGFALAALAGLVLAAAAVNVTNLVLARSSARQSELAVRIALGCSRLRLVRQLLTESALLGLAGFGVAIGGAWLALAAVATIETSGPLELRLGFILDRRIVLMSLALALIAGLASGLGPALIAVRNVPGALRRGGRGRVDGSGRRFRAVLVVLQVAASFIALVFAGLIGQTVRRAEALDLGLDPRRVLITGLDASQARLDRRTAGPVFDRITASIRALPGVDSVAVATSVPLTTIEAELRDVFQTEATETDRRGAVTVQYAAVTPQYFGALGIPVLSGRGFRHADDSLAPRVAIINEQAATLLWPDGNPLGRTFRFSPDGAPIEIVGVVPTGRYLLLTEAPRPFLYLPLAQWPYTFAMLVVKTRHEPLSLEASIRDVIAGVHPDLTPLTFDSMERWVSNGIGGLLLYRLGSRIASVIGGLALVLAMLGLYGVLSYSVRQSTREIGLRMALGAAPGAIVGAVVRQGTVLVAIGLAVGLPVALLATRGVGPLLFGVGPTDLGVFLVVGIGLVGIAAAAALLPARRAARLHPAQALRAE